MQTVPAKWNDILAGDYQVDFKAVINGKTYTYGEIKSARITKSMMDKLTIGQATSAMLDMVFEPDGAIPTAAEIKCYIRLANYDPTIIITDEFSNIIQTDDGYVLAESYSQYSDWLPFGTFYIDTRSTDASGWMTITAYDRMLAAERDFPSSAGSMTMSTAVTYIANQLGITVDSRNSIAPYSIDSPAGVYTMREVLCGIAAASGGNFIITENNKLRLISLKSPSTTDDVPVMSCDILGDAVTIGKVTLYPDSDTQYSSGTSGYEIQADCIYATQTICDYVKNRLNGVTYLPYSAGTAFFNPALELGDSIKPNGKASVLASAAFTVGVSMSADIDAPIDTEVNHEYPYQARTREERRTAQSFSEIKKTTEQIALSVQGKVDSTQVQSAIDLNLNSLSLSYSAGTNGASITLSKNGVSITGDVKIGSIDASQIQVTNLNASNITTGYLYGMDIVGCTLRAAAGGYDYAQVSGDGMRIYTGSGLKAVLGINGSYPALILGDTSSAYVEKLYRGNGHEMWIGDGGMGTGLLINFTQGTVKVVKNGAQTNL